MSESAGCARCCLCCCPSVKLGLEVEAWDVVRNGQTTQEVNAMVYDYGVATMNIFQRNRTILNKMVCLRAKDATRRTRAKEQ